MAHIDLESDLLNYIIQQGIEPGEYLPTIRELSTEDHLNVSTSKIREQLEVARAMGLVEVRSKTGTRLKPFAFGPSVRLALFYAIARDFGQFELFGLLRHHVEVAFWHEACALLTEHEQNIMRQCVLDARQKLSAHPVRVPTTEHRIFHLTVFSKLENPFVIGLLEAYWDAYDAIEPTRYADYQYHQTVWDFHERILDLISAGDHAAALETFIEHTRLLRYEPHHAMEPGHLRQNKEDAPGN